MRSTRSTRTRDPAPMTTARGSGGCLVSWRWVSGSSTPLGFVMSASSTASSWKSVYRLHCDPGRSVPMTALASPTTLGSSGGTKLSPHDTYSTSSVPMRSMPSSSYSSPCSEKMRRAAEVRSSFIVASSSSSAIEAGRTASLPTLAPTQRRVMRVGIGAACNRARPRSGAFLALPQRQTDRETRDLSRGRPQWSSGG